jgi:hypothetical protein
MGLIGGQERPRLSREAAGHVHWSIFSAPAVVEEPLLLSEGSVRVLNEPVPRNLGRGGNRGSRSQELVRLQVQVLDALLDLGGANKRCG